MRQHTANFNQNPVVVLTVVQSSAPCKSLGCPRLSAKSLQDRHSMFLSLRGWAGHTKSQLTRLHSATSSTQSTTVLPWIWIDVTFFTSSGDRKNKSQHYHNRSSHNHQSSQSPVIKHQSSIITIISHYSLHSSSSIHQQSSLHPITQSSILKHHSHQSSQSSIIIMITIVITPIATVSVSAHHHVLRRYHHHQTVKMTAVTPQCECTQWICKVCQAG